MANGDCISDNIIENRVTHINLSVEYKVLYESEEYYIVEKAEDKSIRAIEKNRCSVVIIRGPIV